MKADFDTAVALHRAGKLADAERLYCEFLQRHPGDADTLHLLGVLYGQRGRISNAISLIRRAVEIRPQFAEAYSNLARLLIDAGEFPEAAAAYFSATKLLPHNAQLHYGLGIALRLCNRLRDSYEALIRAVRILPGFAEAYSELGTVLRLMDQLSESITFYTKAIALNPNLADAHNGLGNSLAEQGSLDQAVNEYLSAIQIDGKQVTYHKNLASALGRLKRFDEAILAYEFILQHEPGNVDMWVWLGRALMDVTRYSESATSFARALQLDPHSAMAYRAFGELQLEVGESAAAEINFRNAIRIGDDSPEAWIGLGVAVRSLGRFNEASEAFRKALALAPDNVIAYKHLSTMGTTTPQDMSALRRQLEHGELSTNDRIAAIFAEAKHLDETEQYDQAFRRYSEGNAIVRELCRLEGRSFDKESLRAEITGNIQAFDREFFSFRTEWGDNSELPVFVVGMPRSGTTLVEQIVASHPEARGLGELPLIGRIAKSHSQPTVWSRDMLLREAANYLEHTAQHTSTVRRLVDKMPANILHAGLVAAMFPKSRIIFCRRDPRDTCLSCYFQWFAKSGLAFSYDLVDCATQYLEQQRLERHWLQNLPVSMLTVQYEEMVADLEGQSRRLIDFLGLKWDSRCLDFHKTQRPVNTSSVWQVRQPIYGSSVGRWQHYEKHLYPLIKALEM